MNILPKKRWHVRTKENIARVRKDEAEAAEIERQEKLRVERAEREARLNALKEQRKKTSHLELQQSTEITETQQHINFFSDLEHAVQSTNKEHDKDIKDKKEEYEKKIGYLTYLGQDTNEALGKKNWYEVLPASTRYTHSSDIKDTYEKLVLRDEDGKPKERSVDVKDGEIAWKAKQCLDPLNNFKQCCTKPKNEKGVAIKQQDYEKILKDKRKKHRSREDETKSKLQKLREARLKRELHEKHKTKMFLPKLNSTVSEEIQPKYNSQFNPELARQNYR